MWARSTGSATQRRLAAALIALVAVAVLLVIVLGRPWAEPTPVAQAGGCRPGPVGASPGASFMASSQADLDADLGEAKKMGMSGIRIDVDWSVVEATRGQRNWTSVDRVVDAIRAQGLCPVGLVTYAPRWATNPTDFARNSHFRPADPNTFADFAAAAARRYANTIGVWEVWNEPNASGFWGPRADVGEYGRLLQRTYTAIKSAVSGAVVVSGGLSPAVNNGRDIAPLTFVQELYRQGFGESFDALGVHPYTYPAMPSDPSTASWNTAQAMWRMRDEMVARGDSGKKIWMTEFGAPTGMSARSVSEAGQATSFREALQAQADTGWLGPLFVYSIRDSGTNPFDPEQNFGVLRRDRSPKEAYAVFAR